MSEWKKWKGRRMEAAVCDGKQAFDTPQLANRVARRRRGRKKHGEAYKCPVCGLFHIGRM